MRSTNLRLLQLNIMKSRAGMKALINDHQTQNLDVLLIQILENRAVSGARSTGETTLNSIASNERWAVHDAEIARISPAWLFWTRGLWSVGNHVENPWVKHCLPYTIGVLDISSLPPGHLNP
jgi:hypothetical protein